MNQVKPLARIGALPSLSPRLGSKAARKAVSSPGLAWARLYLAGIVLEIC
jgi:hypothetical protein